MPPDAIFCVLSVSGSDTINSLPTLWLQVTAMQQPADGSLGGEGSPEEKVMYILREH